MEKIMMAVIVICALLMIFLMINGAGFMPVFGLGFFILIAVGYIVNQKKYKE